MTGLPAFNYPAFTKAGNDLADRGIETLNPVDIENENDTGAPQAWDWYMRRAIRMISGASGVCLLPGWQQSKGAQLEMIIAESLGLDIRPLNEWLKEKVTP